MQANMNRRNFPSSQINSLGSIANNGSPTKGFNSTTQRFSYMKEMQKASEPGPGSYDGDLTTIGTKHQTQHAMFPGVSVLKN
jgi:hypothetical protein